ncbi:ABC transporter substrate-binding protein [Bacillus licheniformis]|nr:ABC transporter substrate-binding protein [Bacillus licheniformis]
MTITTKEPFPEFPSELVHPNTSIIDVSAANISQQPVGTGPFQVSSFEAGHKIELERYDDYWDGKPKLKHVTFSFNEDANARVMALQSKMPISFTDRALRILTKFKRFVDYR